MKINKKYVSIITTASLVAGLAVAVPAFAQTAPASQAVQGQPGQGGMWGGHRGGHMRPGVFGTVASINGTTLTVTSKVGPQGGTATTYTVDASAATVTKSGAASSVSIIAVGATVMIQGTVSGTSVTAKTIRDGIPQRGQGGMNGAGANANPIITGNGEPVVAGSVTAISGSSVTITNKSNVTYTIDASNAKIQYSGGAGTIANVAVGDNVVVQGTVNGTSVTASSVIDQGATPAAGATATGTNGQPAPHRGFFAGIGSFFKHLFGF